MTEQYFMPTHVVVGEGCVRENGALLREIGQKAFVVTGAHSAKACGALDDVTAALEAAGCTWTLFDGVMANPTIACAYAGAEKARACGADFVLAIGGGSPMDAGKAIALLAKNPDLPEERLFSGQYPCGALPIVCVPTTAGTGSEVTKASILTNDRAQTKSSISHPVIFPRLSFVDGRYTWGLSLSTTINTAIDALSHAAEGMLSCKAGALSDCLAKEALARIAACFPALEQGSLTPSQRQSLLIASTEAGMVIANTGTTAVHGMGYSLTYFQHIDHGRANGLLFAAFLDWMQPKAPDRVGEVLKCLGFDTVEALRREFATLLGAPEPLSAEQAHQYAAIAVQSKNLANCLVVPDQTALEAIYRKSFGL